MEAATRGSGCLRPSTPTPTAGPPETPALLQGSSDNARRGNRPDYGACACAAAAGYRADARSLTVGVWGESWGRVAALAPHRSAPRRTCFPSLAPRFHYTLLPSHKQLSTPNQ